MVLLVKTFGIEYKVFYRTWANAHKFNGIYPLYEEWLCAYFTDDWIKI